MNEGFAGIGTSTAKVVEQYYPEEQRIIDDPLAYELLPFWWKVLVRIVFLPGLRSLVLSLRERRMPGSLGSFLCRARFIDDELTRHLKNGAEQVVILGAGFDSRPYRIKGVDRAQVFEIDLPGASRVKRGRVKKVLGAVPENVTLIGMDFEQQCLEDVLQKAGYRETRKTFFIWEGVTQYLTPEAVDNTLRFITQKSVAGSAVVFTWVRRGIIDGTDRPQWLEKFLPLAEKMGSPWLFGLESVELRQFLQERGLRLVEDIGFQEFQKRYLEQTGRKLIIFEGERTTLAEVIA